MFRQSPECFLITPHSDAAHQIQTLIRDVLQEQGVELVAAETISYRGAQMGTFANAIERAHFVIADITDRNLEAIFELGVAYGLRKRSLILSQRQTADDTLIDIGGQPIILYDPEDTQRLHHFISNWVQESVAQVFAYPTSST
jgi:hypothetical protein